MAVVAEEAGEALRGALNIIEAEEKLMSTPSEGYEITLAHHRMEKLEEELMVEVAQTGAMALRWLLNRQPLYASNQTEPRS